MLRRHLIACLALAIVALPALAQDKRLTAEEIELLLAGNTAFGTFDGSEYSQYFTTEGTTVYQPKEGEPDEGKWRVDAESDLYQSWWESTGWLSYAVERREDALYWIDGDDAYPFVVRQGEKVGLF